MREVSGEGRSTRAPMPTAIFRFRTTWRERSISCIAYSPKQEIVPIRTCAEWLNSAPLFILNRICPPGNYCSLEDFIGGIHHERTMRHYRSAWRHGMPKQRQRLVLCLRQWQASRSEALSELRRPRADGENHRPRMNQVNKKAW